MLVKRQRIYGGIIYFNNYALQKKSCYENDAIVELKIVKLILFLFIKSIPQFINIISKVLNYSMKSQAYQNID